VPKQSVNQGLKETASRGPRPKEVPHLEETSAQRSSTGPQDAGRKALVILGMHRSGTSALGGALSRLGVDFGRHLTPPAKDNPRGYFEHPQIVALHDQLLRALGSRWDDDRPFPPGWAATQVATETRSLLVDLLKRDFGHVPLFGIKDPRMCRLVPLWFPIFESLGVEPHFILIARHPWEVAESLERRDGLEASKGYLLWLDHTLQAELATRVCKRSLVSYEQVLNNPIAVLDRLQAQLQLPLLQPEGVETSLREFLEPSLQHHRFAPKNTDFLPETPSWALEVYETVSNGHVSGEFFAKLDELNTHFLQSRELFYPRVNDLEGELAHLDTELEETERSAASSGNIVRLEVFHPVEEGYRATESQMRYFRSHHWKLLTVDLPGRKEKSDRPLRIDPATYPALVEIAEITLRRADTGEILWIARMPADYDEFEIAGTASRLPHDKHLRILSFGGDPQLVLPPSTAEINEGPMRLQISILVNPDADRIKECLAVLNPRPREV
jgi:hypothetical protein